MFFVLEHVSVLSLLLPDDVWSERFSVRVRAERLF